MGSWSVKMKTHKREDLTSKFLFINDCVIHKCKPKVLHIVAGKHKESHYVVQCKDDDCGKISMHSAESAVTIWNHYNPLT